MGKKADFFNELAGNHNGAGPDLSRETFNEYRGETPNETELGYESWKDWQRDLFNRPKFTPPQYKVPSFKQLPVSPQAGRGPWPFTPQADGKTVGGDVINRYLQRVMRPSPRTSGAGETEVSKALRTESAEGG